MANLIIKPTSGGSLILQDEGGTAANTIDASGNTQLAGTLGVTGNVTMSGTANTLGTVTTGNISNAAIVYPSGHIIQFATPTSGGNDTTGASHNTFIDTVINNSITPKYADSDILLLLHFRTYIYSTGGDAGASLRVKKVVQGGATTYPDELNTQESGTNMHSWRYWNPTGSPSEYVEGGGSVHFVNTNVGTTSEVTYTLQYGTYNVNSCAIGGTYSSRWSFHIMEIKG